MDTYDILYRYHASTHTWNNLYTDYGIAYNVFIAIRGVMLVSIGHAGTVTLLKNGQIIESYTTPEKE